MKGNIFNSKGIHVGVIVGREIFDRSGTKLYDLKGINIYRLSRELIGHLNDEAVRTSGSIKRPTACSRSLPQARTVDARERHAECPIGGGFN